MLFGTNGVRGRFNELNPELAMSISKGIGRYFKGKIGVARDARLTGECLEGAVVSGLCSVGCDVIKFGIISSPTAEFMVKELGLDGLIIITASHNPPEWNALKVVDKNGVAVSRERGIEIENLMKKEQGVEWNKIGKIENYSNACEDHIQRISELVDFEKIKEKKLKIILDYGNGAAATIGSELFEKMGCEIIEINKELDGTFPSRPSEPTEKNVQELIERVKKENANAGIAWDGDGDRIIFVDELGNYVIGDKVFALSTIWKLNKKKGDVVSSVATSKAIEDIATQNNVKTIYTRVGAPYLSEEMNENKNAVIGGEEVGGVILPEICLAKDGLLTGAKLCEALCEKKLSEWVNEIPIYFTEKIKIEVKDEMEKKDALNKVKEYTKENKLKIIDVDGIRINYNEGWAIIRGSGTEPVIRIFAEGKTKEKAKEYVKKLKEIIS